MPEDNICSAGFCLCKKTKDGGRTCRHNGVVYWTDGYDYCPWKGREKKSALNIKLKGKSK